MLEKEKMPVTSIFSFSTMFSALSVANFVMFAIVDCYLLTNAFNLDKSKILSFGKELKR